MSETEFSALRQDWQELLGRSGADPLFMSWDWQWLWWKHHGVPLRARLRLFAVRSSSGRLLALLPLYERTVRVRGLPLRRLELIGHAWHNPEAYFSEYLDLIVDRDAASFVLPAVFQHMGRLPWDELAIAGVLHDSHMAQAKRQWLGTFTTLREEGTSFGFRVSLAAGF
ncbi:MAG: hypothetical protein ABW110_02260, partial [Steroidobacteraceae bacterium]